MQLGREQRYQDVNSFWTDITEYARGEKSKPIQKSTAAGEATRYYFVYRGELAQGVSQQQASLNFHKNFGYSSKQIAKLFSGKPIVVRKNISYEKANAIAEKFKLQGAIGKIEEMQDATRIVTRPGKITSTLPSVSRLEAISLADIKAAADKLELEQPGFERDESPSKINAQSISNVSLSIANKTSTQSNFARNLVVTLAIVTIISASVWLYMPWRYQMLDFYHYSILENPIPRGVTSERIDIGMSAAFSGSAREIGHSMRTGINAYFQYINQQGGIHGRQIKLVELDDGYEPQRALANMDSLLDPQLGAFALLGNVGTPTAKAILPVLLDNKTIVFGTFSGSSILRNNPPDRYVFNYRASYADETSALIDYYTNELEIPASRIAIFFQNDSYGLAGVHGVETALHKKGISHDSIVKASYERNTAQVSDAVELLSAPEQSIDAIVMVSTYAASAEFIKQMQLKGYQGKFANVSFVGSTALVERLQEIGVSGNDVLISQVVPPFNSYATGVLKYREHLNAYFPGEKPNFISLEGYIVAQIFCEALIRAGRHLDTEIVVEALESIKDFDLGIGSPVSFSLSNHQGSHRVWGTKIDTEGNFELVELRE
ncbi:ABC transporter substrate-binding protein [Aliikangiella marina]